MDEATAWCANAQCGRAFEQRTGPGRRKAYCSPVCRRQAQRRRDAEASPAAVEGAPSGQEAVGSMAAALGALAEAERAGETLEARARLFGNLAAHAERYLPLAVHEARLRGAQWEEIARSTGVTVATARGRWSQVRIAEVLSVPVRQALPVGRSRSGTPRGLRLARREIDARQRLADALDFLLRASGLDLGGLEEATSLPEHVLIGLLSGEALPAWPEVAVLAAVLGVVPSDLRSLWEWAAGKAMPSATSAEASRSFKRAIRGLHLAAGCPSAAVIAEQTGLGITAAIVADVLRGQTTTAWRPVAAVVRVLGADAWSVRALWLTARSERNTARPASRRGRLARPGARSREGGAQ